MSSGEFFNSKPLKLTLELFSDYTMDLLSGNMLSHIKA